jgi:nicotinate-nucleotide adenylyltransferase
LKLGILGGTFDPIHFGHLRTAEELCQELGLEKVYLIPSASPPHKNNDPIVSFQHRLDMVRMAVEDTPLLEALDLEGNRPGLSYSIGTLQEIHDMFDPVELFFILGTDAFLEIETWKEYRKLFDYAHFIVIQRAGHEEKNFTPFLKKIREDVATTENPKVYTTSSGMTIMIMSSTFLEISSTRIRQMLVTGKSVRFLLPETVREYIVQNGLYNLK